MTLSLNSHTLHTPLATQMPCASTEEEISRRVLIVDDEEPIRTLFHSCLSDRYICFTARSDITDIATCDGSPPVDMARLHHAMGER